MASVRPKLVQEGKPLEMQDNNKLQPPNHHDPQSSQHHQQQQRRLLDSTLLSTAALNTSKSNSNIGKSKFRMVIGGESDKDELPDDPEQYHRYNNYHHHQNLQHQGQFHSHHLSGYNPNYHSYNQGRGSPWRGGGFSGGGRHFSGQGRLEYFNGDDRNGSYRSGRGYINSSFYPKGHRGYYGSNPNHDPNYRLQQFDNYFYHHQNTGSLKRIIKNPKSPGLIQSRFVIGEDSNQTAEESQNSDLMEIEHASMDPSDAGEDIHAYSIERMEGVISLDPKEPLVVMDGANIAYAYADAMVTLDGALMNNDENSNNNAKRGPDCRGLVVATNYFLQSGIRVLVVLPAPWFRLKPRSGDANTTNSMMLTDQVEILNDLKARGLLVMAPPRDDDDAYALTIARREHYRFRNVTNTEESTSLTPTSASDGSQHCPQPQPANGPSGDNVMTGSAHVLSNDMFRDAMARDPELEPWLNQGGRISFAFCDLGSKNDYGDKELDFIPNPRHALVSEIERQRHAMAAASRDADLS